MYEIKKGIPLPGDPAGRGAKAKYPFADMADGDCFDVAIKNGETMGDTSKRVRRAADSFRARHQMPMSYLVRPAEEGGIWFIRVWASASAAPVKRAKVDEFGLGQ